jgi:hypothetical protein
MSYKHLSPEGKYFIGISLRNEVRIISGNTAVGANDDPANGVDIVVIDDLLYGEPQAVVAGIPEPGTLLLLGSGLIGFGFLRRNKAKRS